MTRGALAAAVRAIRIERGLAQEDLAVRAGLHLSYVSGIERGDRNPNLVALAALADGLGVPLSQIFAAAEGVDGY